VIETTEPQVQPAGHGPVGVVALLPEVLKTLLLALIIFLTARLLLLPYQVDGRSMEPSLADQERVLVNRAVYMHFDLERLVGWVPGVNVASGDYYPFHSPERGDVVVVNPPWYAEEPFIKRTIGVAGDTITIRDGQVLVNGMVLDEPYLYGVETDCRSEVYCTEFVVPPDTIFVMGDNRPHSFDSREFGPVPLENVIGQAWFSNWPADRFGPIPDVQPEGP
jgi:signal peptidase I